ncbi:hypothetical protein DFAR_1450027 [Desulfarculales bacterium]
MPSFIFTRAWPLIYRPCARPCSNGGYHASCTSTTAQPVGSHHLEEIIASLGIALVHSPPYVPQGRGKIEKSFRTVRSQFLPGFKGDTPFGTSIRPWRAGLGTSTTSASICGHRTGPPVTLHKQNIVRHRPAPADTASSPWPVETIRGPSSLIGKQIILLYHDHDHDRVEVLLENRSHGLLGALDLAVNCKVKRDHHLLRLESSSSTALTGGSLFSQKPDPEVSNS